MSQAPDPRRAVTSLLGRHAAGFAINAAGTVFLARHFGPYLWGIYAIGYTVQYIAQGLVERGAAGYLIQRRDPPGRAELATVTTVQLALGVGAALFLGFAAPLAGARFASESLDSILIAVALAVALYAIRAVPMGLLERSMSYRRVALVEVGDIAAFNAAAVLGVAFGMGLQSLAVATVVRAAISLAIAWRLAGAGPRLGGSTRVLKELVAFGLPYTGSNALGLLNGAAAPLLVGTSVGVQTFGVLQLAYSLISYPQVINGILGRVAFPFYARMNEDAEHIRTTVSRATSALITYVGIATIGLAASSPVWVPAVYGLPWREVSPIMITTAPALGIGTAFTFVIAALNASGRIRSVLLISVGFTFLYWSSAIVLVPTVGQLGLPLAYSIASLALVGYVRAFRRSFGSLVIGSSLLRFLIACLVLPLVACIFVSQR